MQISVSVLFGADELVPEITIEEAARQVLFIFQGDPDKDSCFVSVQRPPVTTVVGALSPPPLPPDPKDVVETLLDPGAPPAEYTP